MGGGGFDVIHKESSHKLCKMCVDFTGLSKENLLHKRRIKNMDQFVLFFFLNSESNWLEKKKINFAAMDRSVYHFEWRIEFHLQGKKGAGWREVDISVNMYIIKGSYDFCCVTKKKLFIIIKKYSRGCRYNKWKLNRLGTKKKKKTHFRPIICLEDPQNEYLILMMIRFHFSGGK